MKRKISINKNVLIALAVFLTIVITSTLFASPVLHGHKAAVDISNRERLHLATVATSVATIILQ